MRTSKFAFAVSVALFCLFWPAPSTAQITIRSGSSDSKPKSHKSEEQLLSGTGKGVTVSASLGRGNFRFGSFDRNLSGPTWSVTVIVQNHTDDELELGESLIVVEKLRESPLYLANYVARARSESSPHLQKLRQRYGWDWGYRIDPDGSFGMQVPLQRETQPFISFGTSGSLVIIGRVASYSSSTEVYEGLGYGRVSPRAERRFKVEVPLPVEMREGAREYITVILPAVRPVGAGPENSLWTLCNFEGGETGAESFKLVKTDTVAASAEALRALVADSAQPLWLRVCALNWQAESYPREATDWLIKLAVGNKEPALSSAAALNLGALKAKSALQPLLELLSQATENRTRRVIIEALSDIGENAAASAIRLYINNADQELAETAIAAASRFKDAEAVNALTAILGDNQKKPLHAAAISALVAIGDRAAITGLMAGLRHPDKDTRAQVTGYLQAAIRKAVKSGGAEAVTTLAAVAANGDAPKELRQEAVGALGKYSGAETLMGLRGAAESAHEDLRNAALAAFAQIKEPAAAEELARLAEQPAYPSRTAAISLLRKAGQRQALPALRRIVADKQAPSLARQEACLALEQMNDSMGAPALLAALDDADGALYDKALHALGTLGVKEAEQAAIAALKSRHDFVRKQAAAQLRRAKVAESVIQLWQAYQLETKEDPGAELVAALIELRFADQQAVPFLIKRLEPKKNPLWFEDVQLLRHLTNQQFGPTSKTADKKERGEELKKWRKWAEAKR